jgi:type I restriction enzyme M protein
VSNTSIDQSEINRILWAACDTFRGTVDPAEYKNYILVMLFVKYISDVWHDHYQAYLEEYDGDEIQARRMMRWEKFVLPEGSDFATLYEQRNAPNVGELINEALMAIEEANKSKLEGVFRNIDFNSESALGRTAQRNQRLRNLLNDFADPRLDLRPSRVGEADVIGDAYEFLIGKFAAGAGKKAGEFYTPPAVSRLIAKLVDPQPGDRICDPACGSGSLLIRCVQEIEGKDYAVYGQENNGSTWALAKMNMFLHDVDGTKIQWGDTLQAPTLLKDDHLLHYNVVVANPPFSLKKWGKADAAEDPYDRFWRGLPPKNRGDYAFLSHMVETTLPDPAEDGRVGVVVPHGVLFRSGSEGKIRRQFVEENLLNAVIGLPENLFFGTGIPAAILLFKRHKADDTVLFIDASREYAAGTPQNKLREEDITKIVGTYRAREFVDKYAYVADYDEIKENGFNLNIPRYVDTYEPEPDVDLGAVAAEIEELDEQLTTVEKYIENYLKELSLHE